MTKEGGILILTEGQEKYVLLGEASFKLMLGPGARVVDLKNAPSGHLVMKVDDFARAKTRTKQTAYTLHVTKGEPHLLEEHDVSEEMEDALTRDRARATWPWQWDEKEAANAAGVGSSTDPAPINRRMLLPVRDPSPPPAANAAPPPPPPSWLDPEQRETMMKSHTCMMTMSHEHLDHRGEEYGDKDDAIRFNLYTQNIVHSCMDAWFNEWAPAVAASGAVLPTPSEGEIERWTRNMQAKMYQRIQHEVDCQVKARWPTNDEQGNLPERYNIHSD